MPLDRPDLGNLVYFAAIAKHKSFRRASTECGVSASALSHALTGLEERLGVRLLNRTTRSVTLTAAGEEFLLAIERPMGSIAQAIDDLGRYRDHPAGRIRLNVMEDAATLLLGPVLPVFAARYPAVEVDVAVSNQMLDVIAEGFDAGIRYGGTVPEDMIARALSAPMRWMAAAAPIYLAQYEAPQHPHELRNHQCIRIKLGSDAIYDWEFDRAGEGVQVATPGQITVDSSAMMLNLGLSGVGIIYGTEELLAPHLKSGALIPVLRDWSSMGPGFEVYYSGRRHLPSGLRLLIDLVRDIKPCGLVL